MVNKMKHFRVVFMANRYLLRNVAASKQEEMLFLEFLRWLGWIKIPFLK
jgi:hypothetical protein